MSLLYAVETCLRATRIPPSRFGRDAVKDPRLVHDLRRGRQPGAAIEKRVREHIAHMLLAHGPASAIGTGHSKRAGRLQAGAMRGDF